MASGATGVLDEACQRLHQTGPQHEGRLSGHGPMGAESKARHGHGAEVGRWLDGYAAAGGNPPRQRPGRRGVGADWREAQGDPKRIACWTVFFQHEGPPPQAASPNHSATRRQPGHVPD
jgi:hypothetical protein